MVANEIYFTGNVQGVCFRANTKDISKAFLVSGYVKNLDDGRVYLFVQGEDSQVTGFIDAVTSRMKENITQVEKKDTKENDKMNEFQIRY